MDALRQYLLPYLVSNTIFILVLVAVALRPMIARIFFVLLFLWAASVNTATALKTPQVYLEYASMALIPAYRDFINTFFAQHIQSIVLSIASCQMLISIGMMLYGSWVKLACLGGILFSLAIAPLGVGSGFPSTVLLAIALYILYAQPRHDFIWRWRQYSVQ
jgi:hypothetical protein